MARMTKAEMLAHRSAARVAYEAEQSVTYLPRLMALLERAQVAGFNLTVEDGVFVLVDRDERDADRLVLTPTYVQDFDGYFDRASRDVDWKEEREREAQRKFLAKQNALAKLNTEERELLGLNTNLNW